MRNPAWLPATPSVSGTRHFCCPSLLEAVAHLQLLYIGRKRRRLGAGRARACSRRCRGAPGTAALGRRPDRVTDHCLRRKTASIPRVQSAWGMPHAYDTVCRGVPATGLLSSLASRSSERGGQAWVTHAAACAGAALVIGRAAAALGPVRRRSRGLAGRPGLGSLWLQRQPRALWRLPSLRHLQCACE